MTSHNFRLLYISYWGLREPLGQSLMIPPLLRMAKSGLKITLVSFEKPHHLSDKAGMEESRRQMQEAGIHWIPLRYHKTPTAPATLWDITQGAARSILASLKQRPDIIHGRTYLGGLMGFAISRVLRRPFVYHNEGFWPDEQIDGGNWPAGCRQYRITKRWERNMYRRAAGVITLSQPAREIVTKIRRQKSADSTVVVPSCVDLEHFQPENNSQEAQSNQENTQGCRLLYIGSLGFRYRTHDMARFVRLSRQKMPNATLTIYSHSDHDMIRREMRANGVQDEWCKLDFVPHSQMPHEMKKQDAGLFFLAQGVSSQVCSPTKIGEYWACGLPVVTTPGVGDIDAIVQRERVGVIVKSDDDQSYLQAAEELRLLLQDPDLAQRCRQAAERYYSIENGVETQLQLYLSLSKHFDKTS